MNNQNAQKITLLFTLAIVIWAVCAAVMFIGTALMALTPALIVHALAAPFIAAAAAWFYFRQFPDTPPFFTAAFFTLEIIIMDLVVVAMIIEQSFSMFSSLLGTWIPFSFIFIATYLTGRAMYKPERATRPNS